MMTRSKIGLRILAVLTCLASDAQAGPTKVSGWVVLDDGNPAVGFEVATLWEHSLGKIHAYEGVKTDADGRFTIPVESYGRRPSG